MEAQAVALLAAFIVLNGGCGVFCNNPHYCKTGSDCTLKPVVGKPETIVWTYHQKSETVKLVDWDPLNSDPDNIHWFPRLNNSALLDSKTGALTILNINKTDSGLYMSEIQVQGVLRKSQHDVIVVDPISKPEVTCDLINGTIVEGLKCNVTSKVNAAFKWKTPDGKDKEGWRIEIPPEQPRDSVYFCTAKNEVSEETKEFNLKDCTGPDAEPGNRGLVGIIVILIILVLAVCGLILLYKLKVLPDWIPFPKRPNNSNNPQTTEPEANSMLPGTNNRANPDSNQSDEYKNVKPVE